VVKASAPPVRANEHWEVDPASELKLNDGLALLLVAKGPAVIATAGATVSIVNAAVAGALTTPEGSNALTLKT
jgi:hypothetical protein